MTKSSKIRDQFINFFKGYGHTQVRSAPVVPVDDPTLLFTNAGMNQFKDVFLERGSRPYSRAVDSQKCIRVSGKHNDLEEVGTSPHHHTFFEMLGNWSFGDYYKPEAIRWAWKLLTDVWKIDLERLYATYYAGDDQVPADEEARQLWIDETSITPDRISAHGKKDNFWEMGATGPCGPCSEIHYDLGKEFCDLKNDAEHVCSVNGDCARIVEIWNLVFIQYQRGKDNKLTPLPTKHIDTGAGFERLVRIIEGVNSNYETSLFAPIISNLVDISGSKYFYDVRGVSHRVIADHIRSISFAIADGVTLSNEGRGYVIRRILRRAARYGRKIGLETPFLYRLVKTLTDIMGESYPELTERYDHIVAVIKSEEVSFARTLGKGIDLFSGIADKLAKTGKNIFDGNEAFKLYDTYGFPLDLTQLMASERGLTVDTDQFHICMTEQQVRSGGDGKLALGASELGSRLKSEFVGYEEDAASAKIMSAKKVDNQHHIITDKTPFYAESGGQEADWGRIETGSGRLEVSDIKKVGDAIVHIGKWNGGELPAEGADAVLKIDTKRRLEIKYNHTATHLLHTALRTHLGKHAAQAGSLVAPDRLRFDFTHFEKLSPKTVNTIEVTVNDAIRKNYQLDTTEMPYKSAIGSGVIALFGEKYGDEVRVVKIGEDVDPYSRELCGGTHVDSTGQIGQFRITYEGSVSAGVRRIEAVTGAYAHNMMLSDRKDLSDIKELISSHGSDTVEKLAKVLEEKRNTEKDLEKTLAYWAESLAGELLSDAHDVNGVNVIAVQLADMDLDRIKLIGDSIRRKGGSTVALLSIITGPTSAQLCCIVSDEALAGTTLKAGKLIGKAAKLAGGGGGGRPHLATAGTKTPDKISIAIDAFTELVRDELK